MDRHDRILRYLAAVLVFKSWRDNGLINEREFIAIDTKTLGKYGLSLSSIYRLKT